MKVCLVLTHQCNLGCSYCYAGEKFKSSMNWRTGLESLRLAFSRPGPVEVSFFGGEPMIAFDTLARLTRVASRWARRAGRQIRFSVTTNATILKDKHLRFLKHYNFFVGVSLDGVEEVQDRQRPFVGGRGSGELVWRNLEAICRQLEDFRVLMVVRPDTLALLPAAVERMYRLGVSKLSLLPEAESEWSDARPLLTEVYHQLARICYLSMLTEEPMWISPFVELHPGRSAGSGREGCGFGADELAVSPAGNFYPCARLVGPDRRAEVRIGNLEQGMDWERISQLQAQADEHLSSCGTGGCKCLALMPGDQLSQLANVAMFSEITGQACLAAETALEMVAA
ncbi:MAG: radical SAM protein [Candidatus Eremiobacteraeota bacterium]|nr:radical SAM protein [Candidatus Eremiobacteraeota bacterium]MCW5871094.1 radical SAM protein [Candidatus Eremiobacteraeota bacterium]